MVQAQPVVNAIDSPVVEKVGAERRRFHRVRMDVPGRFFVPSDSLEASCKIIDLSPGGACVDAEILPDVGTPIVLYINGFGRFEGAVARRDGTGFGDCFVGTQLKQERTADLLAQFMNNTPIEEFKLRRNERSPTKGLSHFTRNDGSINKCEVLNLSPSGVSIRTVVRPQIGEFVLIAQLVGRVVRYHLNGIGIEFSGLDNQSRPIGIPGNAEASHGASV